MAVMQPQVQELLIKVMQAALEMRQTLNTGAVAVAAALGLLVVMEAQELYLAVVVMVVMAFHHL